MHSLRLQLHRLWISLYLCLARLAQHVAVY